MAASRLEEVTFADQPAVRLTAGRYRLHVATSFGPRVTGLEFDDSGNLLAVLPDAWLPTGDGQRFRFRGGHRLWVAPEVPALTYRPDDVPVAIEAVDDGVRVSGALDTATGLRRTIVVRPADEGLEVRHVIANEGSAAVRLAAWAITQLPLGGRAWLPIAARPLDGDSPRPDRLVVLWPYTDLADPRLTLRGRVAELEAVTRAGDAQRCKIGSAGRAGRLAYLRDGWLVEKNAVGGGDGPWVDHGAAAQVYLDERFLELETLGPLVDVPPGSTVEHVERWGARRADEAALRAAYEAL